MRTLAFSFLVALTIMLTGCLPEGKAEQPAVLMEATVTAGELEIEAPPLPKGCVASVAELPLSIVAQSDDPRLQSDNLLVVVKSSHRVMLFSDGLLRHDRPGDSPDCWRVGLGTYKDGSSAGAFDKQVEGDRRTPVGWYRTSDKPVSSQYHSILIHYPDERHAKQALDRGAISTNTYKKIAQAETAGTIPPQNTALGGNILLHGGGSSTDWTWGCIALNNIDQDELRELLPTGMRTRILILP